MNLTLKRTSKQERYTQGRLYVNDAYLCDTLEPPWHDLRPGGKGRHIPGHTAIPEGRYPVVITYSPALYQWLPLLLHVPGFKGIRIHAGNTVENTRGCILVGYSNRPGQLIDSRLWLRRLKKMMVEAKEHGEGVWMEVK